MPEQYIKNQARNIREDLYFQDRLCEIYFEWSASVHYRADFLALHRASWISLLFISAENLPGGVLGWKIKFKYSLISVSDHGISFIYNAGFIDSMLYHTYAIPVFSRRNIGK